MSFLALLRAVVSSDHLHFHMQSMFVFIVHCNGYFPVSANYKTTRYQKLINSAFNGFSHIYLPLSFIEVIKCTGEFLPHQRKFVDGKRGRVQGRPHAMSLTKINFMHTIVYDNFSLNKPVV